jgi:hypothetical protein
LSASLPKEELSSTRPRALPSKRVRTIAKLSEIVDQWPQYPGGMAAFNGFIDQVTFALRASLPSDFSKVYVQYEFVVDRDGTPVNFKIVKGLANYPQLQALLIEQLEQMQVWTPAKLNSIPVAKKLTQTLTLQK